MTETISKKQEKTQLAEKSVVPPIDKKVYATPKLVVYGDIGKLTGTSTRMGSVRDSGGGFKTS